MKSFRYAILISLFVYGSSLFCDEPTVTADNTSTAHFSSGKTSLGLSNLPWLSSQISIRWWDKNKSGGDLLLSSTYLDYDSVKFDYSSASGFEYIWFDRNRIAGINDAFFYSGMGFGVNYHIEKITYSNSNHQNGYINFNGFFPIGIEHFPIKEMPNLSYSIEAKFKLSLGYYKDLYVYTYSSDYAVEKFSFYIYIIPQFYIRWYF